MWQCKAEDNDELLNEGVKAVVEWKEVELMTLEQLRKL